MKGLAPGGASVNGAPGTISVPSNALDGAFRGAVREYQEADYLAVCFAVLTQGPVGEVFFSHIARHFWRSLSTCPESPVFALDSRLQHDTHVIGDFPLCRLLLSNDSNYPWFVLVPRRSNITEVFQLNDDDRSQLWRETDALAATLNTLFGADKINIGALGNVVSQLHMHVIVRYKTDVAWPAPVWGKVAAVPYDHAQLAGIRARLKGVLGDDFQFVEG